MDQSYHVKSPFWQFQEGLSFWGEWGMVDGPTAVLYSHLSSTNPTQSVSNIRG
ncbi:MAG: hypothetical protein IPF56_12745 [Chloroflexi bacterium]|nr:hypothetical protein [Chloroflexota bacterium]